MKSFIAVAGNIGVGKSTLVASLCAHLGWQPFYEPVMENPYLADFYQDMRSWAFHSQVYFLTRRLRIHRQLLDHPGSAIQDRTVYEDAEIFARNLYLQGLFDHRDYGSYCELYQVLSDFLPPPNLVVYLQASVPTLLERIRHRGRDYERDISPAYLTQINHLYDEWVANFTRCPVLVIPTDDVDFIAHPDAIQEVLKLVQERL